MSLFSNALADMEAREKAPEQEESRVETFEAVKEKYFAALREKALEIQNNSDFDLNDADIRFSTSLNLYKVRNALVAVVGAGGLGNWQWRILAAMGFKRIAIYDDDYVSLENVGPQAHSVFDIGMPKIQACENAALEYRGIKLIARKKRVMTYDDICCDLGESPDIVIGCTDSVDFRNQFISDILVKIKKTRELLPDKNLPLLFIDYRMALGDWTAYIVPARHIRALPYATVTDFARWYREKAVFSEDEALHEPCTERAIAYTGANAASFTGALLHWVYSGGLRNFADAEYMINFVQGIESSPGRAVSFSSRDFEFISDTKREKKLERKIQKLKNDLNYAEKFIGLAYGLPDDILFESMGTMLPENFGRELHGKVIVFPRLRRVILCGFQTHYNLFSSEAGVYDISNASICHMPESALRSEPHIIYSNAINAPGRVLFKLLSANPGDIIRIVFAEDDKRPRECLHCRVEESRIVCVSLCKLNGPEDIKTSIIQWSDVLEFERRSIDTMSKISGDLEGYACSAFERFYNEERAKMSAEASTERISIDEMNPGERFVLVDANDNSWPVTVLERHFDYIRVREDDSAEVYSISRRRLRTLNARRIE